MRRTFSFMQRVPLSTLLIGTNVGFLLLAVSGVAWVAIALLGRLSNEQALGRVTQASTSAQIILVRSLDNAHAVAQLLSERPTLQRLVQSEDHAALATFLTQFQQTSQFDSCSVLLNGEILAQSGLPPSAEVRFASSAQAPSAFVVHDRAAEQLVLGAWATIPSLPAARVIVLHRLDETFAAQVTTEIGLPVTLMEAQTAQRSATGETVLLRNQVLATGQTVAMYQHNPERFVAAAPLIAPTGTVVGIIEITLPAASITRSLQHLMRSLVLLALGVALVAAGLNFALGRWLILPLRRLTRAAARIGQGDLGTPIPRATGAEIGTLAATLEEMRHHLLLVTADLRRQQAESQAIITGIIEGVFSVDRDRHIRYINPQAARMLGIAPEAALGRFCGDVLNPQPGAGSRPCVDQCPIVHARFRQGAHATEHLLTHTGQQRTVVITSAPPTEGLQVQVLRDETEVEAQRRLRDSILAHISHEFRTPLSAQLASIELLLDKLPDLTRDEIGQLVLALQRGTLRLTQLVDNLLESARVEAGQTTLRRRPVALDEVVEAALELIRPLLDQRQQIVTLDLPYPLPTIQGDAPRLTQVFVNLLANAHKYAPAGSTIQIGGVIGATTVTLWVADQGMGLPVGYESSLFQPFARAAAHEPEQSGIGLGLWISKSIVERHQGWIEAQSGTTGTRMCVTLPCEENHENSRGG